MCLWIVACLYFFAWSSPKILSLSPAIFRGIFAEFVILTFVSWPWKLWPAKPDFLLYFCPLSACTILEKMSHQECMRFWFHIRPIMKGQFMVPGLALVQLCGLCLQRRISYLLRKSPSVSSSLLLAPSRVSRLNLCSVPDLLAQTTQNALALSSTVVLLSFQNLAAAASSFYWLRVVSWTANIYHRWSGWGSKSAAEKAKWQFLSRAHVYPGAKSPKAWSVAHDFLIPSPALSLSMKAWCHALVDLGLLEDVIF